MSKYFILLLRDDGFQGDEYDSEPPAQTAKEWLEENAPRGLTTTVTGNTETVGLVAITEEQAGEIQLREGFEVINE